MMRLSVLYLSVLIVVVLADPEDKYTTKYDNINLDDILSNDRLFQGYFRCLVDMGTCTPDGVTLRDCIKDALETDCEKCSEKQEAGAQKVLKFLIEEKPEEYAFLEKKFDPKGIYKKKYHSLLVKNNVKM